MEIYKRETYLKRIRGFYHDDGMIKVLTGVRRCGKSCVMHTIAEELIETGTRPESVIFIDLDDSELRHIRTDDELEKLIRMLCKSAPEGMKYIFIDEVQNVKNFEEVLNGFRNAGGYSIFITGSNSYLLSGELVTKLTGRYIKFEIQTLSFKEYVEMKDFLQINRSSNLTEEFDLYVKEGGFPKALTYASPIDRRAYVKSVVDEITEKDVLRRVQVRNLEVFESVMAYMFNNYGNFVSITNIQEELIKSGIRVKHETISRYVRILEDANIVKSCKQFDLKSKRSLRGHKKYYLADLSFYFANYVDNRINYGPSLENVVFNYARYRGYEASVGRIGKLECDFLLRSPEMTYSYVQVAMTIMSSNNTEEREYRCLESIKDNYPKYIVTRNDILQNRSGINHVNAPEFMIKDVDF